MATTKTYKIRSILITGANRGIGFHIMKECIAKLEPKVIIGTFRNVATSKELKELSNMEKSNTKVHLVQMDVRDEKKYEFLFSEVDKVTEGKGLNVLFNNAGVTSKYARISGVRKETLLENFEINTIAPILITKTLLPLLEKANERVKDEGIPMGCKRAAVLNMSSILGSISSNDNGGLYPYRCSKSALNAATMSMSKDLCKQGILAVAFHPGWVKTDMGGPRADINPEESAQGIVSLMLSMNETHNGKLIKYDGTVLPW